MKEYIIGAFLAFALMIGIQLSSCNRNTAEGAGNGKRVDSVLVVRHDTIRTIDTLLKKKIIYRDTGRIEYIHDDLDKITPPIGDENVCIAENQLRQCVKCQDSLESFKMKSSIDSQTIDTLTKLAKTAPDTIKITPSILDRVKDFGAGLLVGVGIRSFF